MNKNEIKRAAQGIIADVLDLSLREGDVGEIIMNNHVGEDLLTKMQIKDVVQAIMKQMDRASNPNRIELEGKSFEAIKTELKIGDRLVFRSGVIGTAPAIITRKITGFAYDGRPEVTHNGPAYRVALHEIKAVVKEQD